MDTKLTKGNVKSDSLPVDLMMDIFKRLPVKTLIRFLSLSKLCASIIRSRDFRELFLNASLTRPRGLLFVFKHGYCGLDFSSVLSQNTNESSSLITFHVDHSAQWPTIAPSVQGLICYGDYTNIMIYNPCTRRSFTLPEIDTWRRPLDYYLGHDPNDNDYKVLCTMTGWEEDVVYNLVEEIQVFTVGTRNSWKMIDNNIIPHTPFGREMCINGVLYYQASNRTKTNDLVIISFDVRSEKLHHIKGPSDFLCTFDSRLTSDEGKLAVISCIGEGDSVVNLFVLEDAAKGEWSKKSFALPTTLSYWRGKFSTNVTDMGEIIFAPENVSTSVCELVCYDMKTKSANTVQIRGITESAAGYLKSFSSNLVENLMFL